MKTPVLSDANSTCRPSGAQLGSSQLRQVAVFNWSTGEFVDVDWGDELNRFVSAGGEIVLRARPSESGYFDEGILLNRYSVEWGADS